MHTIPRTYHCLKLNIGSVMWCAFMFSVSGKTAPAKIMVISFQSIFPDSMVFGRVIFSSNPSWQNNCLSALFSQRRSNFFKRTNSQSSQEEEACWARQFLAVEHCPVRWFSTPSALLPPTPLPHMHTHKSTPALFKCPAGEWHWEPPG